jgi:3-hydroxymyristoyl/3-hydroxydecanoyl-(acyl carrier protein) dehydratase
MAEFAAWPDLGPGFAQVLDIEQSPDRLVARLAVPANLDWFRGHFPGEPVLPGIIQTHWAAQFARAAFDYAGQPQRIKRLKFKQVVVPPQELAFVLTRTAAGEVQFAYSSAAGQHSEGRLVFSPA